MMQLPYAAPRRPCQPGVQRPWRLGATAVPPLTHAAARGVEARLRRIAEPLQRRGGARARRLLEDRGGLDVLEVCIGGGQRVLRPVDACSRLLIARAARCALLALRPGAPRSAAAAAPLAPYVARDCERRALTLCNGAATQLAATARCSNARAHAQKSRRRTTASARAAPCRAAGQLASARALLQAATRHHLPRAPGRPEASRPRSSRCCPGFAPAAAEPYAPGRS